LDIGESKNARKVLGDMSAIINDRRKSEKKEQEKMEKVMANKK
jgi:hypothetical protein